MGGRRERKIGWGQGLLGYLGAKKRSEGTELATTSNLEVSLITKEVLDPRLRRRAWMANDIQQQETEPQVRETRDYEDPAPASRHVQ